MPLNAASRSSKLFSYQPLDNLFDLLIVASQISCNVPMFNI